MTSIKQRQLSDTTEVISIRTAGFTKHIISARFDSSAGKLFKDLRSTVSANNARALSQVVLGGCRFRRGAFGKTASPGWPVTWLQGDPCDGKHLFGSQVLAISGIQIRTIRLDGRVVGTFYEDDDAVYCHLGDILPRDKKAGRTEQARQVFEEIEAALGKAGMLFTDVIRTRLYLDRLLEWYGEFNAVRTKFFTERGVYDHLLPASTGIGGRNPGNTALIADVIAIRPKTRRVKTVEIFSPLQCPARNYRSSFSRAVEVMSPGLRELYISGTASISPDGSSAHTGDTHSQIALTMKVVEAILKKRKMGWKNVTRAIAYFQNMREAGLFREFLLTDRLPAFPFVTSHADVCRPELTFEIEVDAARVC